VFSRFTQGLFDILRVAIGRSLIPVSAPLTRLLTQRVARLRDRFLVLLAQFRAGTLPPPRPSRAATPRPETATQPARPALLAPHKFAEMLRPIPETAWHCRCFLEDIVNNNAEVRALVAAAPQAGRVLRVFSRMLGGKPAPWLALPRRPRVRKPRPPAARKPADASKLGRIAYANLIAPECRDGPSGTRPPNRIGYGRARSLPRDYRPSSKNE
jgi:hypothetical protein